MLAQFLRPILDRQKTRFPKYIAQLESIATDPNPRKTVIITLAAIMAHDLRNDLTVIGVVLELDAEKDGTKGEMPVLPV